MGFGPARKLAGLGMVVSSRVTITVEHFGSCRKYICIAGNLHSQHIRKKDVFMQKST